MVKTARRTSAFRALLVTGISTFAVISAPAFAQAAATAAPADQAAADEGQTGDIIVTAQFRSQRLQDTPLAITAVDAATIEAKSLTNLAQLADNAPNVSLKPQGTSFGRRSSRRFVVSDRTISIRPMNRASASISTMSITRS